LSNPTTCNQLVASHGVTVRARNSMHAFGTAHDNANWGTNGASGLVAPRRALGSFMSSIIRSILCAPNAVPPTAIVFCLSTVEKVLPVRSVWGYTPGP
jgi:hypothetical protein